MTRQRCSCLGAARAHRFEGKWYRVVCGRCLRKALHASRSIARAEELWDAEREKERGQCV